MSTPPLLEPIRFLVRNLTKFIVIDRENLPSEGSVLLTTNHLSRLDTPLLLATTERNDLVGIIAKKYRKYPFIKWILSKVGTMVWMDRERTDFSALRDALEQLRLGAIVGIAPEGTRSRNRTGLLEGKQGAALLAARADVPIVPVGIVGSEKINQHWLRLQRPPVTIRIGEPYTLPEMDRDNRQAWLTRYTTEIMCRIAALLPSEYHGFYSGHPRLQELLAQEGKNEG